MKRYRSLSGIENIQNNNNINNGDIKIPLFDKESSDFCFEKSREILSKPFSLDISASALDNKHFDQKTRDLIGENLMDIEKTLNALNLDFLKTYNDLEKADSAETLFGENYATLHKAKATSALVKSQKSVESGNKVSSVLSEKTAALSAMSPSTQKLFINFAGKKSIQSPKTRSDPKFNFKDYKYRSTIDYPSSRGDYFNMKNEYLSDLTRKQQKEQALGSSPPVQKTVNTSNSSISQLLTMYNTPLTSRKYDDSLQPNRQRSLSFTENYDLKSPPNATSSSRMLNIRQSQKNAIVAKERGVITYKPKSVRARNLRRLSYNPISMIDSSSSSSDSPDDVEKSIALSECDIRTKLQARRRKQYVNRKYHSNSASSQDKLYGSNASIKSAPQYNYNSDRQFFGNYPYNYSVEYGDGREEDIYDFGGTYVPPPPSYANKNIERDYLFNEFDVSKLTGKSPTTHGSHGYSQGQNQVQTERPSTQPPPPQPPQPVFQWPEKIHGAVVKQNDMALWRKKNPAAQLFINKDPYSSDSSSTETDSIDFRREYSTPIMPPSPAP